AVAGVLGSRAIARAFAVFGHAQVDGERILRGRECVSDGARRRGGIGLRDVEGDAVGEHSGRVQEIDGAVAQGVAVHGETGQPAAGRPQGRGSKMKGIFKIAGLGLKLVWAEVHALGPDYWRQVYHRALRNIPMRSCGYSAFAMGVLYHARAEW